MNAFSGDQFGDMQSLLRALGLVDQNGDFVGDWIKNPDAYLKTILADADQRNALVAFVANARGTLESDAAGRAWIEIVVEDVPDLGMLRFYVVMDDAPAKEVRLFLGVRLDAGMPTTLCRVSLLFPLFRAAKAVSGAPTTPDLIGEPGGVIELTAEFLLSDAPPAAGEATLAGLGLLVSLPTDPNHGEPVVGLSLTGLQPPGETEARDLSLSLTDPAALQEAGIELILALLQAQVGADAGDEIAALARLLGLDGSTGIHLRNLDDSDPTARVAVPSLAFLDPASWLASANVLGQSGPGGPAFRADRVAALLDALRPLTGATGPSGTWAIMPGLGLGARDASGLVLELTLDAAAFQSGSDIAFGGSFGLHFASGLSPRPLIATHVGLRGGAAGTRAVHLTLEGSDLRMFLRPAAGAELGIYPHLSGLADLGLATVINALPAALDAMVDEGGTAGTLVADIGDALLLRTAPPNPAFDPAAIRDWATDPAAALEARWPQLLTNGLAQLGPLLSAGLTLTRPSGGVRLRLADVTTRARRSRRCSNPHPSGSSWRRRRQVCRSWVPLRPPSL